MPDDSATTTDEEQADAPIAHDDIMKRLLDYQRQLREGEEIAAGEPAGPRAEAPSATIVATEALVDLTEVEAATDDAVVEIPEAATDEVTEFEVAEEVAETESIPADETATTRPESTDPEPSTTEDSFVQVVSTTDAALEARVLSLENAIERIGMMLAAARSDFQDLAIRADERIAQIEDVLASVRGSRS